ncbi:MAG: carbamoyl-phosphate synthase large subunit, partial [Parachlamydiaceae bacterium]
PLAYISTKLQLGKKLHTLLNQSTLKTTAFFEPALDYIVVKIPRWDTEKLKSDRRIGSEMKSVGEVMAIGRTFQEALQKAIRMLNIGASGITDYPHPILNVKDELIHPTDRRLFALYDFFKTGGTVEEAHSLTKIDKWFLHPIQDLALCDLTKEPIRLLKQKGFSDKAIAKARGLKEEEIRSQRKKEGVLPKVKQIDTLAAEFDAVTNYLYTTYNAHENDVLPLNEGIMILGSGPYSIGSSVEFDWCAVNLSRTLRKKGFKTFILNSNPETVSTDFDESDRLYFEELTEERVRDLYEFENPFGVVVSVGGQIANNLAYPLTQHKVNILGTSGHSIDRAENRKKFSELLESLEIDQPEWAEVTTLDKALQFGKKVKFPLLVRPSYVLSGASMSVIGDEKELTQYLTERSRVTNEYPVVLSKFIENAKELEIDGIAFKGQIVFEAISEHIENAGIHSGDATIVLPPQKLYLETIRQAKQIAKKIVKALDLSGPFNLQLIASDNHLKVIEMNVRASRSFPFVAKVTKYPLIEKLADALLGKVEFIPYESLDLDYVGVKSPQFSYHRLKGSNPVAHVEMASTGEVAALGSDLFEAFLNSYLASDQEIKGKRLLLTVGGE